MGLPASLARAHDVGAQPGDTRALHGGVLRSSGRCRVGRTSGRDWRRLGDRLRQPRRSSRPIGRPPVRFAAGSPARLAGGAAGRRQVDSAAPSPRGAAASSSFGAPGSASTAAWLSAGSTSQPHAHRPSAGKRSSVAVRRVTSTSRCGVAGPRSLMRTSTCRPFSRLVSRAIGGKLQGLMRGGECGLVEHLAVGGEARMVRRIDDRQPGLLARRSSRSDSTRRRRPGRARRARSADRRSAAGGGRTPRSTGQQQAEQRPASRGRPRSPSSPTASA